MGITLVTPQSATYTLVTANESYVATGTWGSDTLDRFVTGGAGTVFTFGGDAYLQGDDVEFLVVSDDDTTVTIGAGSSIIGDASLIRFDILTGETATFHNAGYIQARVNTIGAFDEAIEMTGEAIFYNSGEISFIASGNPTQSIQVVTFEDADNVDFTNTGTIYGSVELSDGDDVAYLANGVITGTIRGNAGDDTFYVGTQTVDIVETSGQGFDTIYADGSYSLMEIHNVEALHFTRDGDFNGGGNDSDNTLGDTASDNVLRGRKGDDTLWTSFGDDLLKGGQGNDTVLLTGFYNHDAVVLDLKETGAQVLDEETEDWTVTLKSIENVTTYVGGTFKGTDGGNVMMSGEEGAEGEDDVTFKGRDGDDTLMAGEGNDVLEGGKGDDALFGYRGANILDGGNGDDELISYVDLTSGDVLTGGKGKDTFILREANLSGGGSGEAAFNTASFAYDVEITDFDRKEDFIGLSGIGDVALTWIDDAAFDGTEGQVRYTKSEGQLEIDLDGDLTADYTIWISNEVKINEDALIL